jgi:hypothetical protein
MRDVFHDAVIDAYLRLCREGEQPVATRSWRARISVPEWDSLTWVDVVARRDRVVDAGPLMLRRPESFDDQQLMAVSAAVLEVCRRDNNRQRPWDALWLGLCWYRGLADGSEAYTQVRRYAFATRARFLSPLVSAIGDRWTDYMFSRVEYRIQKEVACLLGEGYATVWRRCFIGSAFFDASPEDVEGLLRRRGTVGHA